MADEKIQIIATMRDDASKQVDGLRGKLKGLSGEIKTGFVQGLGMAGGLGVAGMVSSGIGAIKDFVGSAIDAASSLEESQSKVNVVFGESAAAVSEWASGSAESFGMSKRAALEAAGTYGNLFQAFGMGRAEAQGMSQSLVELAADLASFNNTSIEDALEALRSGLSGETEPLKRYGIAISDARMRTELLSQGVTDLGSTLTPLQKTTAAYALIMKDSSLAQGDFARTSDGLANTQRILAAEMEDLSAEVGAELMPLMKDLLQGFRDLIPVIRDTIGLVGELGTQFSNLGGFIFPQAQTMHDFEGALKDVEEQTGRTREEIIEWARGAGADAKSFEEFHDRAIEAFKLEDDIRSQAVAARDAAIEGVKQTVNAARQQLVDGERTLRENAASLARGYAQEIAEEGAKRAREAYATAWGKTMQRELDEGQGMARRGGGSVAKEYAQGLRDQRDTARQAWQDFLSAMENPISHAEDLAWTKGKLVGKELAAGLKSSDPVLRAQALATQAILRERFVQLTNMAYNSGQALSEQYSAGIRSRIATIKRAVRDATNAAGRYMEVRSPAKEGALSLTGGPEEWGKRVVSLYAKGMDRSSRDVRRVASDFTSDVGRSFAAPSQGGGRDRGGPIVVNVDGHELFRIMDGRMGRAMALAGSGTVTRG